MISIPNKPIKYDIPTFETEKGHTEPTEEYMKRLRDFANNIKPVEGKDYFLMNND